MPLVNKKGNVTIQYKLSKRRKNLISKEFLKTFRSILIDIFKLDENLTYEEDISYLESTSGWADAFERTCLLYGSVGKGLLNYYKSLPWYDSDSFNGEISNLMIQHKIIEKGSYNPYEYDYANDNDFELEVTVKKYKGYNVITKEWWVKE